MKAILNTKNISGQAFWRTMREDALRLFGVKVQTVWPVFPKGTWSPLK